jgi:hypothetical protein
MGEKKIFRVQEAMLGMDEIKLTMEGGDATGNNWLLRKEVMPPEI